MARSRAVAVAVIGGGASGLAAAKCLLDEGMVPTVFEQSSRIGGVWSFDDALPDGGSPAYRSLRTNTRKQLTAFSDFPFRDDLPNFPACADVASYLSAYVDRFGIRQYIQFNTRVDAVVPADRSRWTVHTSAPLGQRSATFDAVFICNGMFGEPSLPHYARLADFPGTLLHSRSYIDAEPFVGKRVLVVGIGSSGVDIAVETGQVARQVFLSGRNDAWKLATAPAVPQAGAWRARLLRHLGLRSRALRRRRRVAGPDAPFVMQRDRLIVTERLRCSIEAGAVTPRPGVVRVEGSTVHFADGSSAEVDAIICATGYQLRFPFLDESIFRATPDGLGLYRTVFHPDRPTLAFIGMSRASGPILPLAEMQARWAARVLSGAATLPPPPAMRAAIEARRDLVGARGGNPFRLEFEPYMDMLAAEIGALPHLWRRPQLWKALLSGKPVAARYRLDGPGRRRQAARILKSGNDPAGAANATPETEAENGS